MKSLKHLILLLILGLFQVIVKGKVDIISKNVTIHLPHDPLIITCQMNNTNGSKIINAQLLKGEVEVANLVVLDDRDVNIYVNYYYDFYVEKLINISTYFTVTFKKVCPHSRDTGLYVCKLTGLDSMQNNFITYSNSNNITIANSTDNTAHCNEPLIRMIYDDRTGFKHKCYWNHPSSYGIIDVTGYYYVGVYDDSTDPNSTLVEYSIITRRRFTDKTTFFDSTIAPCDADSSLISDEMKFRCVFVSFNNTRYYSPYVRLENLGLGYRTYYPWCETPHLALTHNFTSIFLGCNFPDTEETWRNFRQNIRLQLVSENQVLVSVTGNDYNQTSDLITVVDARADSYLKNSFIDIEVPCNSSYETIQCVLSGNYWWGANFTFNNSITLLCSANKSSISSQFSFNCLLFLLLIKIYF